MPRAAQPFRGDAEDQLTGWSDEPSSSSQVQSSSASSSAFSRARDSTSCHGPSASSCQNGPYSTSSSRVPDNPRSPSKHSISNAHSIVKVSLSLGFESV